MSVGLGLYGHTGWQGVALAASVTMYDRTVVVLWYSAVGWENTSLLFCWHAGPGAGEGHGIV